MKDLQLLQQIRMLEQSLQEFVTIKDLMHASSTSDMTKKFLNQRELLAGSAPNNIYLEGVLIEEDSVSFSFISFATKEAYKDNHKFKKTSKQHDLKDNPEEEYLLYLKFLKTGEWVRRMKEKGTLRASDIKQLVKDANVQVFSTSPAFVWQGSAYWAGELDAAIFPSKIKPQKWNQDHLHGKSGNFLDKHLTQLILNLEAFYNEMAKELADVLKGVEEETEAPTPPEYFDYEDMDVEDIKTAEEEYEDIWSEPAENWAKFIEHLERLKRKYLYD